MINRVHLVGRVGRAPEVITFGNGSSVVNFTIATNRSYKDKEGNWKDVTTWHNIQVGGPRQEQAERLNKGDLIYIEGEIDNRMYEKEGVKFHHSQVTAKYMRTVQKAEGEEATPKEAASKETPEAASRPNPDNDDLPF